MKVFFFFPTLYLPLASSSFSTGAAKGRRTQLDENTSSYTWRSSIPRHHLKTSSTPIILHITPRENSINMIFSSIGCAAELQILLEQC